MSRRYTDPRGGAMSQAVLAALQKASEGLVYPSDADAPFTPFSWGKAAGDLDAAKVRQLAGAGPKAAVQERTLDAFFGNLTSSEAEDADKYRTLMKVVGEQLAGAKVFRVGDVELDIYLVGKTPDGDWAGLKTKSVET